MLVFFDERLVFLAVPKTGTTAIESALRGRADIVYRRKPGLKHVSARKYKRAIAPFFEKTHDLTAETMAVIRDPLDQIRSWFRYRNKDKLDGHPNSAKGMSFEDYVLGFLSIDPPQPARLGTQYKFLTDNHGNVIVDHLFAYENLTVFKKFLNSRFGEEFEFRAKNVSPQAVDTSLSAGTEAMLRTRLADDFALHKAVLNAGHWQSGRGT